MERFPNIANSIVDAPVELGREAAELCAIRHARFSDRDWADMAGLVYRLIDELDLRTRRKFADVVAKSAAAPRDLALLLAYEPLPVAEPVLRAYEPFTEDDLSTLVGALPSAARQCIAARLGLPERVAGDIVSTGDVAAIVEMLANHSAQIGDAAFSKLTMLSRTETRLHDPLVTRPDVPWPVVEEVLALVSETLQHYIAERWSLDPTRVRAILARADSAVRQEIADSRRLFQEVDGSTTLEYLHNALTGGNLEAAATQLAHLLKIPRSGAEKVLRDADGTSFFICLRAAPVADSLALRLLDRFLRCHGSSLASHHEDFAVQRERMSRREAKLILGYWRQTDFESLLRR